MSGDFKGRLFHAGNRYCARLVDDEPWRCYQARYHDACCESCGDVKEHFKFGKPRPTTAGTGARVCGHVIRCTCLRYLHVSARDSPIF